MWTPLKAARQYTCKTALKEAQRHVKKPRGGQKLTWIKMIEKDLETERVMVAKQDGTIFVATDEYLANNVDRRAFPVGGIPFSQEDDRG